MRRFPHRFVCQGLVAAVAMVAMAGRPVLAVAPVVDGRAGSGAGKEMAFVKVEVRLESGKVLKHPGEYLGWDEDGTVTLDGEGHAHAVEVRAHKVGDGKKLEVRVSYLRDSQRVIAPITLDTKPARRELLHADDGLALAITVTPKKVDTSKKKRDESIDGPENPDDPLDGLK
jgi:hypothetical protein